LIKLFYKWLLLGLLLWVSNVSGQTVTLNFKDMDIQQLVNIISEISGKTFIVDPRVKANVNVISNHPMDAQQVYEVFLSILNVHGFAAVEGSNDIVKIVPDNMAKAHASPVLTAKQITNSGNLITTVVWVKHVAAAQLVPLLRPLLPQHGHIVAYPANNSLIISDYADNVQRISDIIQRIDRPSNEDIEIMPLQHAAASEVVRILTNLYQRRAAEVAAMGGVLPSFIADDRTNSVLISADQASLLRLRTIIGHLDAPLKTLGNTKVIYLRHAQATDLVEVLKGISDVINPQPGSEVRNQTRVQADTATNSLIITANLDVLQNLEQVIEQLDIRRAQVLVEAVIAEVSADMANELGIQWLSYGQGVNTTPVGLVNFNTPGPGIAELAANAYAISKGNTSNLNLADGISGALLGLGRIGGRFNFALLLRALAADSHSNVLSTPSLLTLDNQEAEIIVGQNVPFVTGQYTNTGAATGATNPFQTIQREDIGIKLKVKPQINAGEAIKLAIEQEVSSLTRSSVATADVVTNKRTIKTTVIVEDGNTIVLGGLTSEDLQQVAQKVPILGDIPLLGALFRSQGSQKIKRNLMIFLHPIIIRDAETERSISQDKYQTMQQIQQQSLRLSSDTEVPILPNLPNLNSFINVLPNGEELFMP
jgi:general secretion pathway protein D